MGKLQKLSNNEVEALENDKWSVILGISIEGCDGTTLAQRKSFEAKLFELTDGSSYIGFAAVADILQTVVRIQVQGQPLPAIYHALELTWQSLEASGIEDFCWEGVHLGDDMANLEARTNDPKAPLTYFDVSQIAGEAVVAVVEIQEANDISDLPGFLPA